MSELQGQVGELRFTVEIKRAASGKIDKYEMTGKVSDDGGNAQHSGSQRRN